MPDWGFRQGQAPSDSKRLDDEVIKRLLAAISMP
jgi:hypothetical protein